MGFDPARIEEKIDKTAATAIEVSSGIGGIRFQNMIEVMETAKMLSLSGPILPKWLQNNPGGCWAIIIQASEWGLSPVSVAQMSFEVNGVVRYVSQLLHAVIEARAPLSKRLRGTYEGEGDQRVCIVTGYIHGEAEPFVLRTPPIGKISPKNSPLWKTDPDQQLWYYGTRAWARRYCPEVLLGVYGEDEAPVLEATATEVKPDLASRLPGPGKAKGGFSADHVERETKGKSKSEAQRGPASAGGVKGDEPAASVEPASGDAGGAAPESAASDRPPQASPASDAPAGGEGDSSANPPDRERLVVDVAPATGEVTETKAAAQEAAPTRKDSSSAALPSSSAQADSTRGGRPSGASAEPVAPSADPGATGLSPEAEASARDLHRRLAAMADAAEIQKAGEAEIKARALSPGSPHYRALNFVTTQHVRRAKGSKTWTPEAVEDSVEGMLMRETGQPDLLGGGA